MNKLNRKLAILALFFSTVVAVEANVEVWHSGGGQPQVVINIDDDVVIAKVANNLTEAILQQVNSQLWSNYGGDYVLTRDFNKDGVMDVAVLSGASLGGSMLCYSVYEYDQPSQAFKTTSSFSWCK